MAGTCTFISRHVIELSSKNRASRTWGGGGGASFCWPRISAMNSSGVSSTREVALSPEGPSCIFVGPIETASQETLEALYCQVSNISSIWKLIFTMKVCVEKKWADWVTY
jgi:hypothetical protein